MFFTVLMAVISIWSAVIEGAYNPHTTNGIKASVECIGDSSHVSKRSVGESDSVYKRIMAFRVSLEGGKFVNLVLQRNDRQTPKVKVKVASDSGTQIHSLERSKDYRFYQVMGENHGAALMVVCANFPYCSLAGRFYHQGQEYVINPESRVAKPVANIPHTVHTVKTRLQSRGDDTVQIVVNATDDNQDQKREFQMLSKLLSLLKQTRRDKRSASTRYFKVELEMVICDDIYTFWYQRLNNDSSAAIQTIVEYFEQVANNMDLRFSSVASSTMEIDIIPYLINIRQTASQCSWVTDEIVGTNEDGLEAYNADTSLTKFQEWALSNKDENSDAVMSFSRRDMWRYGDSSYSSTTGLANQLMLATGEMISATCLSSYVAASIVEDLIYGDTSSTASHELAHNFGVHHDEYLDGGDLGDCPASESYIMASSGGFVDDISDASNPWTFSPCSIAVMESTLTSMETDSNGESCLEQSTYDVTEFNRVQTSDLLGEIYSRDEQCELIVGTGSTHCDETWTNTELDEICWKGLPCALEYYAGDQSCISWTWINAAAGTNCGGTKQCYRGNCVESADIPTDVTDTPGTDSSGTSGTNNTDTSGTGTTDTAVTDNSGTSGTTPAVTTTAAVETYTQEEIEFLNKAIYKCSGRCGCWRRFCSKKGQTDLCIRFAPACYEK